MAEKKTISVIERRLQGKSALTQSSAPIPMKQKGWTLRWEDDSIRPDQVHYCVTVLGWEYVTPEDLDVKLDDIGARARDNRVVRGERGKEVLLKMTEKNYAKVQKMKSDENTKNTFDKRIVQNAMLNAVGSEYGSEAAEYVQRANVKVQDARGGADE